MNKRGQLVEAVGAIVLLSVIVLGSLGTINTVSTSMQTIHANVSSNITICINQSSTNNTNEQTTQNITRTETGQ